MRTRGRTKDSYEGRKSWGSRAGGLGPWIVLSLTLAIPLVGLGAGLLVSSAPDREVLPAASPVTVSVEAQSFPDAVDVELGLTWEDGVSLVAPPWNGVITQVVAEPGASLQNAARIVEVDGTWRVAALTPRPFYAGVTSESTSAEIGMLNQFLASLSLEHGDGEEWTKQTVAGVRAFAASINAPGAKQIQNFDPSWVVWLPTASFDVAMVNLTVGKAAPSQGEAIVESPPSLVSMTIGPSTTGALPILSDGVAWEVALGDLTLPLSSTQLTAEDGINVLYPALEGGKPDTAAAQVRRSTPIDGWAVPATAVFTDSEGDVCIFLAANDSYDPVEVRPIGGLVGTTRVAGELPDVAKVLVNPVEVVELPKCR